MPKPCCGTKQQRRQSERLQRQEMTERAQQADADDMVELEEDTSGVRLSDNQTASLAHTQFSAEHGDDAEYVRIMAQIFDLAKQRDYGLAEAQAKMVNAIERALKMLQTCETYLKQCDGKIGEWSTFANGISGDTPSNDATKQLQDLLFQAALSKGRYFAAWKQAMQQLTDAASFSTKASETCKAFLETSAHMEESARSQSAANIWFSGYNSYMTKLKDLFDDLGAMCTACLNYVDDSKFNDNFLASLREQSVAVLSALESNSDTKEPVAQLDEVLTSTSTLLTQLIELIGSQTSHLSTTPRSHLESLVGLNKERLGLDKEYFATLATAQHPLDMTLMEDEQAYERCAFAALLASYTALDNAQYQESALLKAKQELVTALDLCADLKPSADWSDNIASVNQLVTPPENKTSEKWSDIVEHASQLMYQFNEAKGDVVLSSQDSPRHDRLQAIRKQLVKSCQTVFDTLDQLLRDEDVIANSSVEPTRLLNTALDALADAPAQTLIPEGVSASDKAMSDSLALTESLCAAWMALIAVSQGLPPISIASTNVNDKMEEMFDIAFILVDASLAQLARDPRTVVLSRGPQEPLGLKLQTSHGTRGVRVVGTGLNSVARNAGSVYPGDAVCKINGTDVTQRIHEDVIALISQQQGPIEFVLARDFPNEPRYITLKRSNTIGLGFTLELDHNRPRIREVIPGSPAFETQQIKPGQYLLEVDGVTTENMALGDISQQLRTKTEVQLCVGPLATEDKPTDTPAAVLQSINIAPPESDAPTGRRTVVFDRSLGLLGIKIGSIPGRLGVYVTGLVPETQASACPDIFEGDYIISINGHDVTQLSREEVTVLIKEQTGNEIEIVLDKEDPLHETEQKQADEEQMAADEQQQAASAEEQHQEESQEKVSQAKADVEVQPEAGMSPSSTDAEVQRRTVVVRRNGKESLGMHLIAHPSEPGVSVLQLVPNGPAAKAGVIPGEYIYSINDKHVRDLHHDEIVAALKEPEGDVTLVLEDPPVPNVGDVRTVVLEREQGESLGLRLFSRPSKPGVVITELMKSGAVSRVKSVFPYDEILSVNGVVAEGMSHDQVVQLLAQASSPLKLQVARIDPGDVPEKARLMQAQAAAMEQQQEEVASPEQELMQSHDEEPQVEVEEDQQEETSQQETSNEEEGSTPAEEATTPATEQTETMPSVDSGEGKDDGLTPLEKRRFVGAVDLRKVTLDRQDGDIFGMKIGRKNGVPYIVEIIPGGLAERSGKLRPGDVILAINGQTVYKQDVDIPAALQRQTNVSVIVAESFDPSALPENVRTVHVTRMPGTRLGLVLLPFSGQIGAQIYGFLPDGVAIDAGFYPGDRILAINGNSIAEAPHRDVTALFATGTEFDVTVEAGNTVDAHLHRTSTNETLGLVLAGITDQFGVVIRQILANTCAADCEQLQQGDVIMLVNDEMVGHRSKDDVARMMAGLLDVNLRVMRPLPNDVFAPVENGRGIEAENKSQEQQEPPAQRRMSFRQIKTLSMVKRRGDKLGMNLRPAMDERGAIVETVIEDGLAAQNGVTRGDRILAIDGRDVIDAPLKTITQVLNAEKEYTIIFDANTKRQNRRETIRLNKRPNEPLGIRMRTEDGHTYVHEVLPDSVASDSQIQVNDEIITVNGQDVRGMANEAVYKIFVDNDPVIVEVESPESAEAVAETETQAMKRTTSDARRTHNYKAKDLRRVSLQRMPGEFFGIKLGMSQQVHGVRISHLDPQGLGKRQGQLREGDAVLALNSISMLYATSEEAQQALEQDSERLDLVVAASFPEMQRTTRQLSRNPQQPWGLTMRKTGMKPGVYVTTVAPSSPADHAGIRPDDRILAVDDKDLADASLETVLTCFSNLDTVSVVVSRPAIMVGETAFSPEAEHLASSSRAGETTFSSEPVSPLPMQGETSFPPEKTTDFSAEQPNVVTPQSLGLLRQVTLTKAANATLGLRVHTDDNGTVVKSLSEDGLAAKSGLIHEGDVVLGINNQDVTSSTITDISYILSQSPVVTLLLADRLPYFGRAASQRSAENTEYELRVFRLRKASRRLGLVLETRHHDDLTLIKGVEEDSFAAEAGFCVGDIILAVNGTTVEHASHQTVLRAMSASELVIVAGRHVIHSVTLTRAAEVADGGEAIGFGVTLTEAPVGAISVASVTGGSPAHASGVIFPSDRILQINGVDVQGKSLEEVTQLLDTSETATFVIEPFGAVTFGAKGSEGLQAAPAQETKTSEVAQPATMTVDETTAAEVQAEDDNAAVQARLDELRRENAALSEQLLDFQRQARLVDSLGLPIEQDSEILPRFDDEDDEEEADIIDDDSLVVMGNSLTESQIRALVDESLCSEDGEPHVASDLVLTSGNQTAPNAADPEDVVEAKKQLSELEVEADQTKLEQVASQAELEAVRSELDVAKAEQEKLERELQDARAALEAAETNKAKADELQQELEALRAAQEEKEKLAAELEAVKSELDAVRASATPSSTDIVEAEKNRVQALEDQLEDAVSRADAANLARQQMEVNLSQLQAELAEAKAKLDEQALELASEMPASEDEPKGEIDQAKEADSPRARSTSPMRSYKPVADDKVDKAVARIVNDMNLPAGSIERVHPSKYRFFDQSKLIHIRTVGNVVMARVGGGWQNLREYLKEHKNQYVRPITKEL
eukprot:m.208404 g.208404  ORF g.208404 m.208404 type:complete len:2649 (-) comp16925_c4_seq2:88-8034(-)